MTTAVVVLVVCAAILHATWNAMLRARRDLLWSITVMSFAGTALAIPCAVLLPLPASASWPYLVLSSVLQLAYSSCLVLAYRHAELGQVYPIVRGCAPVLVTLGATIWAGERLSAVAVSGIVLVSLGIVSMALGKGRPNVVSVAAALATALIIAVYTVTDGVGARLSGNSYAYVTWIFLLYGIWMPLAFLLVRRRLAVDFRAVDTRTALAAGLVQLVTYGVVIWAFTQSPIGPVSALRETSIVFAALIGRLFLGENLTASRLSACAVIAVGAFCLGWQS